MGNNIYEIMENMKVVRYDMELRMQFESLQYITEGENVISKVVAFIKKMIKKFTDFVKGIVQKLRGDKGGSSEGSGGNSDDVLPGGGPAKGKELGMLTPEGKIWIYSGMMRLGKLRQNFLEHLDKLIEGRDDFNEYCKDKSSRAKILEYYYYSVGVRGQLSKDGLVKYVRKENEMNVLADYKIDDYDIELIDNFVDTDSDKLLDYFERVAKEEKDDAQKLINEIEQKNEYDQNEIESMNCYITVLSHLILAYNDVIKKIYKAHATITKVIKDYKANNGK